MKKELQKKLFTKYKKIFRQHTLSPMKSCMAWGIECGDGWYKIIDKMCEGIQDYVDVMEIKQVEARQVKQKFGSLRVYYSPFETMIDAIVNEASMLSEITCEECGSKKKVKKYTVNQVWISPRCIKCMKGDQ